MDTTKNYILAVEVSNLDGTWPTMVPGEPVGSFDRYQSLVGGARCLAGGSDSETFWECELGSTLDTVFSGITTELKLGSTLDTVFSGITTELKETASGIVNTAK